MKKGFVAFLIIALITVIPFKSNSGMHGNSRFELGLGSGYVYDFKEKIFAQMLHLHGMKNISFFRKDIGIGLSYEKLFTEKNHYSIGAVLCYAPLERLTFSIISGLAFIDIEKAFNLHFESTYNFCIKGVHLGSDCWY